MTYLFDTNAVIKILNGDPRFLVRVAARRSEDFGLSAIVLHELFFGAFKGLHTARTLGFIDRLTFEAVDFQAGDARMAGEIRATLAARGTSIGPYDTLIAGQAQARDLILVTHNTREFNRVDGLRIENWEV